MSSKLESCQGFGKGIKEDKIKALEALNLCVQEEDEDIRAKVVLFYTSRFFSEPLLLI